MKRFLLFIVAMAFAVAGNAQGLKFEGLSTTTSTQDTDNVILNRPLGGGSYGNRVITFANFRLGLASTFTSLTASSGFTITGGNLTFAAGSTLLWTGRSIISSPGDGLLLLTDSGGTLFTSLQFGGSGFTYPALGRVSGDLEVKSADSSEGRAIRAARLIFNNTSTPVGNGMLWHNGTHAYYRDNAGVDHQID